MNETAMERGGVLHRFQSNVVLRIARLAFLCAAALSLLVVVVGLLVALFFHFQTMGSATEEALPAGSTPLPTTIDVGRIGVRLAAPMSVRLIPTRSSIIGGVSTGEIIGYLDAATPNGLATYPDDFDILGGEHAEYFRKVPMVIAGTTRSGLAAGPRLVEEIRNAFIDMQPQGRRLTFAVKVVARDVYGAFSAPTDLAIELQLALATSASPSAPTASAPVVQSASEFAKLAAEIAQVVDPDKGTAYDDALKRMMQWPAACNANEATPGLVDNVRRAFEHARARLTPTTLGPFLVGVCEAWRQLMSAQQEVRSRDTAARTAVEARNARSRNDHDLRQAAAWLARNTTLGVVGAAFGGFLTIALLLALLAIENHSKALREAAAALIVARSPRAGVEGTARAGEKVTP